MYIVFTMLLILYTVYQLVEIMTSGMCLSWFFTHLKYLAFSFSFGPYHIKWTTHRLLRSLLLYGNFEEEKESKLSLYLTF